LLSPNLVDAERPVALVSECLTESRQLLEQRRDFLQTVALPVELTSSLNQLEQVIGYANDAKPLAKNDWLALLNPRSDRTKDYATYLKKLAKVDKTITKAEQHTGH
jgi:hypothetical protein